MRNLEQFQEIICRLECLKSCFGFNVINGEEYINTEVAESCEGYVFITAYKVSDIKKLKPGEDVDDMKIYTLTVIDNEGEDEYVCEDCKKENLTNETPVDANFEIQEDDICKE